MPHSKQSRAREIALQALYQHDVARGTEAPIRDPEELEPFLSQATDDPEVRARARVLVGGTLAVLEELDVRIARAAENWRLSRIAAVDRSILRLALYELIEEPEVPPKVAINEAIELAKKFSTAQSGAFVNGVLDRAYRTLVEEFGSDSNPVEVG